MTDDVVAGREVVVATDAIGQAHVRPATWSPDPGEVLLEVDRVALTSNNVTYAVLGEQLQYWRFFPAGDDGLGIVPTWGFATVVRSGHDELPVGDRWYGYLPMATHVVVRPGRVDALTVVDESPHREGLAGTYQRYQRSAADPMQSPGTADLEALYRPLFSTAWLLDDLVADADAVGAAVRSVVITSASSKTSMALAFLGSRRDGLRVVGLTSPRSHDVVVDCGLYDDVVLYDDAASLSTRGPAALVDVAGRAAVVEDVHAALGDELVASLVVGLTHHDDQAVARPTAGPRPEMFFAPSRAAQRAREWGSAGLGERIAAGWAPFLSWVADRIAVREVHGLDAAVGEWAALVAGDVDPSEGIILVPGRD